MPGLLLIIRSMSPETIYTAVMSYYPESQYKFIRFERSHVPTKKYDAVLKNRTTGREVKVPFGAKSYQQYKDQALGLYSHLDHGDAKRRAAYKSRHSGDTNKPYSASWFSLKYLW